MEKWFRFMFSMYTLKNHQLLYSFALSFSYGYFFTQKKKKYKIRPKLLHAAPYKDRKDVNKDIADLQ